MISNRLAVSTWSLHKKLGSSYQDLPDGRGRVAKPQWGEAGANLLDIPAQAAAHGIGWLEICHFHFPSTEPGYLAELKAAVSDAGVGILSVLVDEGDVTHPNRERREKDEAAIARWIDVAGLCGAARARVIAGDAEPDSQGEALRQSAATLAKLAKRAEDKGVRLTTENWHALMSSPTDVIALLEYIEGKMGLCLDFGNWSGPDKYKNLALIAPFAETTHAKAQFSEAGQMDRADFDQCLQICNAAGFSGPHSLIFDGAGEEWAGIEEVKSAVLPYL